MRHKWLIFCALSLLASLGSPALAQKNKDHRDRDERVRSDNHYFNDQHRNAAREWYEHHRGRPPQGFRNRDRLTPDFETRIRIGAFLDPDLRRRSYPVPRDLGRRLPPAPRGYRYVVIGGNVALVDRGYRVQDMIRVDIRL